MIPKKRHHIYMYEKKKNQKPKGKVLRIKCKIHRLPYLVWFGCVGRYRCGGGTTPGSALSPFMVSVAMEGLREESRQKPLWNSRLRSVVKARLQVERTAEVEL